MTKSLVRRYHDHLLERKRKDILRRRAERNVKKIQVVIKPKDKK
jgi:hypothetical protein